MRASVCDCLCVCVSVSVCEGVRMDVWGLGGRKRGGTKWEMVICVKTSVEILFSRLEVQSNV